MWDYETIIQLLEPCCTYRSTQRVQTINEVLLPINLHSSYILKLLHIMSCSLLYAYIWAQMCIVQWVKNMSELHFLRLIYGPTKALRRAYDVALHKSPMPFWAFILVLWCIYITLVGKKESKTADQTLYLSATCLAFFRFLKVTEK